jgi:hypothetical protein
MRLTAVIARHVPEVRAEMLTWMVDDGPTGYLRQLLTRMRQAGRDTDARQERNLRDRMAVQIRNAELFFVTAPLTELACAAGGSLPEYRLHAEDLPAPIGICVYASPLATVGDGEVRLVSWGPGQNGLTVELWADSMQFWADLATDAGWGEPEVLQRVGPLAFLHAAAFPWRETPRSWGTVSMTAPDPELSADSIEQAERAVIATWLLMGQTLTRSEDVLLRRSSRGQLARAGVDPLMAVRYTDLRRVRTVAGDEYTPGPPGSRYEHQWVVRGHWRNQWMPSRNDHRPIWIHPHIKGPNGAPLLGGERVHLLRR